MFSSGDTVVSEKNPLCRIDSGHTDKKVIGFDPVFQFRAWAEPPVKGFQQGHGQVGVPAIEIVPGHGFNDGFSLGRGTTEAEIQEVLEIVPPIIARIRSMSTAYEKRS